MNIMYVATGILLAAAALCAPVASAQGSVWVVDAANGPGAHFTDVQPAVDAAADCDLVLVRGRLGHVYGGFAVQDKTVTVVGEPDTSHPFPVLAPPVTGGVRVLGLAADRAVVLRGFSPSQVVGTSAVEVRDCAGLVFLEELTLVRTGVLPVDVSTPMAGGVAPPLSPATLRVVGSQSVTVSRSGVFGDLGTSLSNGAVALRTTASRVFLQDVQAIGGLGAAADLASGVFPTDGGTGVVAELGSLFAAGGSIGGGEGGRGAVDAAMTCIPSRDGGTGLAVSGADVVLLDVDVRGGSGGLGPGALCPAGQAGADLELQGGTLVEPPGAARELFTSSPVREGEDLIALYRGRIGDLVVLAASLELADPVVDPAFAGAFHLGPLVLLQVRGFVGGSETLLDTFPVSELGPGVEALALALQPVFIDAATLRPAMGPPSAVALLDAAF